MILFCLDLISLLYIKFNKNSVGLNTTSGNKNSTKILIENDLYESIP